MESNITAARMLEFACTNAERSCIIAHLFTELNIPCEHCKGDNIAICGKTYTGETATLIIAKDGFLFDGKRETIENIRRRRCIKRE